MGNNIQILIFAGTTEGRLLAQYASQHEIGCYVSTAKASNASLGGWIGRKWKYL